jgi:hypothetical protein
MIHPFATFGWLLNYGKMGSYDPVFEACDVQQLFWSGL